jgi:large subunit ribosomal protein L4e
MKKANILDIEGKEKNKIDLPACFSAVVREDMIKKFLETKKSKQPYSPSPVGGKQHSASGKMRHRRHVWQTHYGRGISRIPRKVMSRRGTQFNWVGAEVASTVGGRRAHPPKVLSMINTKKINKKEAKVALIYAISATASEKELKKRYESLRDKKIENLPLIVESKFSSLKIKEMLKSLKKILGTHLFDVAIKSKSIRPGIGKMRGRKYKKNLGLLLVLGEKEKLKTNAFDVVDAKKLSVVDLAKGGPGRLTLYTENAIKNLGEKIK